MPTQVHESTSHKLSRDVDLLHILSDIGYHHLYKHLRLYEYQKKKFQKRGSWVVECSRRVVWDSTKQNYTKLPVFTVQMCVCEKLYGWLVAVKSFSQHWLSILTNKSRVSLAPSENGHILHEATVHIYFLQSTVIFEVKLFWRTGQGFFEVGSWLSLLLYNLIERKREKSSTSKKKSLVLCTFLFSGQQWEFIPHKGLTRLKITAHSNLSCIFQKFP